MVVFLLPSFLYLDTGAVTEMASREKKTCWDHPKAIDEQWLKPGG